MTYREIINAIQPYKKEQYAHIQSDAKLGACAAYYLTRQDVPLTMNYLGIAMFKMFPETFYCDEDFKEYPSLDRLNREICMHMTITKKRTDAILAGSAKNGFQLTKFGEFIGKETQKSIEKGASTNQTETINTPIDKHKAGTANEYTKIINSSFYKEYKDTDLIKKNAVWKLFDVVPFTQIASIKQKLKLAEAKAFELNDTHVLSFIKKILLQID